MVGGVFCCWRIMLPCGCFLPFIEGIIFLPIQKSCFLLVGAIPTYSRCFKSHSNIPTTPPQSYITYRFWPKKSRSTNKRKTKQNKIQQTKTQQNKIQQANKQTATSYPLPSTIWPVKKKTNRPLPSQPPQLQGNACRALEAIPLDSYHRWWLGFNNPPKSANFLSNEFVIIPNWWLWFQYSSRAWLPDRRSFVWRRGDIGKNHGWLQGRLKREWPNLRSCKSLVVGHFLNNRSKGARFHFHYPSKRSTAQLQGRYYF